MITAGTAVRESVDIIRQAGATPAGLVIALDRQERGKGERSAISELRHSHGIEVAAIARLEDIIVWLCNRPDMTDAVTALEEYRRSYGA